ncbi:MAG: tetratricopeptide repeat protein [Chthoniobacterales bacterium]|nr:tetratricopeptide repeat protein [Chthoniobacterales bacterium]
MKRSSYFLLAFTSVLSAQEPEVRRAEPVTPALPADVRRAEPVTAPAAPASAVDAATGLEEVRAAPSSVLLDPTSQILSQANGFYSRKMYDLAAAKYQEFLQSGRPGPDRQAALFRLGESLRALQRPAEALASYRQLTTDFNSGDFLGPGAYRLGEMQYAARDFDGAAASFRIAAHHVRDPKLRLAAKFFEGRALDAAGRKFEALSAYREVASQKEDNPYRERAIFDLADADARAGLTDGAFRQFKGLAETAQNPTVRTSAAVKAGLLAIDNREFDLARPLLESAAKIPEMPAWSGAAQAGLVRLDYESDNYESAAKRAAEILPQLPPEAKPEVMLLAANARRQLGQQSEALALYDKLTSEFPDSKSAKDAAFHRLVSLVAQKDERALNQIEVFLMSSSDEDERARASLLKAELLFGQNRYAEAADLYAKAAASPGTSKYRADALYKLAWCRMQQKQYDDAVMVLTRFVQQFPRHPLAASAYAQRAMAQLQTGQKEAALADFGAIIDSMRGAKEREEAMIQRALLLGSMQRPAEMSAAFERLLAEYPETGSAAQANFWIGYHAEQSKKYREAVGPLEKARELDKEKYGERAGLRLLLCHYQLGDREAAAREAKALGASKTPAEVRQWLGTSALEAKDYDTAIEFLATLAAADDAPEEVRTALAQAQIGAGKPDDARRTLEQLLPRVHEPKAKARVHLLTAEALIAMKDGAKAKEHAEEALRLQPEGRVNAEARLANGRALLAQDRYDDAARAFMSVALLYDEKDITPQALVLAEQAYRKASNQPDADRAKEERERRYPDYKPAASS